MRYVSYKIITFDAMYRFLLSQAYFKLKMVRYSECKLFKIDNYHGFQEQGGEAAAGDTLKNLSAFLTLSRAEEKGFQASKYGLSEVPFHYPLLLLLL